MGSDLPTIVVVDDSAEVRSLIRTRLRLSGVLDVVAEGADGAEAIGLAYQHQPALLLLDVSMPEMDGLDTLPGVLAVAPHTRVVIYTGFEERDLAEQALRLGAAGFIEKSVPVDSLAERLLDVLAVSRPDGNEQRRLSLVDDQAFDARFRRGVADDQRVLDEHLERFREVFDEAAIGMATMTLTGTIVRANRALGALMLYSREDLVGLDYGVLTAGRGHLLDSALADISERSLDLVQFEHEVTGWEEPRKALVTLAPVRDTKGKGLYVFLQAQDITAQSKAEEQLRQNDERFRLLVETVRDYAIFMLDPQGHVVSWNTGAQRIKGYSADEIIGKHYRIFYLPEQQAECHPEHELELAIRDGRYEEEGWRVRKDGTRFWANVIITAIFDPAGRHVGFAKVTRDMTDRRRAEQERAAYAAALASANSSLENANAQLQEAAAAQARLLAVTVHELRTPANVLGGSAATLSLHWNSLSEYERSSLLDGMAASATRLQRLLTDLLTVARLEAYALSNRTERTPLARVLAKAEATVRTITSATFGVDVDGDPQVLADPDRLAQVIENLLHNAAQHGTPPIEVTVGIEGGLATLRVVDAGRGVAENLRAHLFERFATDSGAEGTGLGLFIARELARAQGGDLRYEPPSAEASAGAFVLTVPLA